MTIKDNSNQSVLNVLIGFFGVLSLFTMISLPFAINSLIKYSSSDEWTRVPAEVTKNKWGQSKLNCFFMIFMAVALSACGTTKQLHNEKNIKANKDSNIAFLGLNLLHPDSRVKSVEFNCLNVDTKKVTACFEIPTIIGSTYYVGASPYRVKFGNYKIVGLVYTMLISNRPIEKCKIKDGKKEGCYTTNNEITNQKKVEIDLDNVFSVSATMSPYIGNLNVATRYNEKNKLELISAEVIKDFEMDLQLVVDEDLKHAIKNHVSR